MAQLAPTDAAAQCPPVESQVLGPPGSPNSDGYGYSTAASGDILVVGDPSDSEMGFGAGAVIVYRRAGDSNQGWHRVAKLLSSDAVQGQNFGWVLAVDGNTLAVGSRLDDSQGIRDAGAVYVFERDGPASDSWTEVAKLTASDPSLAALFGAVVAIDQGTLVVGAPFAQIGDQFAGAVYVFVRLPSPQGPRWEEVQKLTAPVQKDGLNYGHLLALNDRVLAVGSPHDDLALLQGGAVFVYAPCSKGWCLDDALVAPDAAFGDLFGSVDVARNLIVVGALGDDDLGTGSGSAYVFSRAEGAWEFTQKLVAQDGAPGDAFGRAVNVEGDFILVSSQFSDAVALEAGAAYAFQRGPGGSWHQSGVLHPSGTTRSEILRSVSLSRGVAVVSRQPISEPGAVHLFDLQPGRASATYCSATPTGIPDCIPSIHTTGNATANGLSEFLIRCEQVPSDPLAVFVFTASPSTLPVQGTGIQCLPGPVHGRSQFFSPGGTPGNCDGRVQVDWGELAASQSAGLPLLAEPGAFVYGQFAFVHTRMTDRVGFSDAVAFVLCP